MPPVDNVYLYIVSIVLSCDASRAWTLAEMNEAYEGTLVGFVHRNWCRGHTSRIELGPLAPDATIITLEQSHGEHQVSRIITSAFLSACKP